MATELHSCTEIENHATPFFIVDMASGEYRGLRLGVHRCHVFFFKLTADQKLVFDWIAGSSQVNLL